MGLWHSTTIAGMRVVHNQRRKRELRLVGPSYNRQALQRTRIKDRSLATLCNTSELSLPLQSLVLPLDCFAVYHFSFSYQECLAQDANRWFRGGDLAICSRFNSSCGSVPTGTWNMLQSWMNLRNSDATVGRGQLYRCTLQDLGRCDRWDDCWRICKETSLMVLTNENKLLLCLVLASVEQLEGTVVVNMEVRTMASSGKAFKAPNTSRRFLLGAFDGLREHHKGQSNRSTLQSQSCPALEANTCNPYIRRYLLTETFRRGEKTAPEYQFIQAPLMDHYLSTAEIPRPYKSHQSELHGRSLALERWSILNNRHDENCLVTSNIRRQPHTQTVVTDHGFRLWLLLQQFLESNDHRESVPANRNVASQAMDKTNCLTHAATDLSRHEILSVGSNQLVLIREVGGCLASRKSSFVGRLLEKRNCDWRQPAASIWVVPSNSHMPLLQGKERVASRVELCGTNKQAQRMPVQSVNIHLAMVKTDGCRSCVTLRVVNNLCFALQECPTNTQETNQWFRGDISSEPVVTCSHLRNFSCCSVATVTWKMPVSLQEARKDRFLHSWTDALDGDASVGRGQLYRCALQDFDVASCYQQAEYWSICNESSSLVPSSENKLLVCSTVDIVASLEHLEGTIVVNMVVRTFRSQTMPSSGKAVMPRTDQAAMPLISRDVHRGETGACHRFAPLTLDSLSEHHAGYSMATHLLCLAAEAANTKDIQAHLWMSFQDRSGCSWTTCRRQEDQISRITSQGLQMKMPMQDNWNGGRKQSAGCLFFAGTVVVPLRKLPERQTAASASQISYTQASGLYLPGDEDSSQHRLSGIYPLPETTMLVGKASPARLTTMDSVVFYAYNPVPPGLFLKFENVLEASRRSNSKTRLGVWTDRSRKTILLTADENKPQIGQEGGGLETRSKAHLGRTTVALGTRIYRLPYPRLVAADTCLVTHDFRNKGTMDEPNVDSSRCGPQLPPFLVSEETDRAPPSLPLYSAVSCVVLGLEASQFGVDSQREQSNARMPLLVLQVMNEPTGASLQQMHRATNVPETMITCMCWPCAHHQLRTTDSIRSIAFQLQSLQETRYELCSGDLAVASVTDCLNNDDPDCELWLLLVIATRTEVLLCCWVYVGNRCSFCWSCYRWQPWDFSSYVLMTQQRFEEWPNMHVALWNSERNCHSEGRVVCLQRAPHQLRTTDSIRSIALLLQSLQETRCELCLGDLAVASVIDSLNNDDPDCEFWLLLVIVARTEVLLCWWICMGNRCSFYWGCFSWQAWDFSPCVLTGQQLLEESPKMHVVFWSSERNCQSQGSIVLLSVESEAVAEFRHQDAHVLRCPSDALLQLLGEGRSRLQDMHERATASFRPDVFKYDDAGEHHNRYRLIPSAIQNSTSEGILIQHQAQRFDSRLDRRVLRPWGKPSVSWMDTSRVRIPKSECWAETLCCRYRFRAHVEKLVQELDPTMLDQVDAILQQFCHRESILVTSLERMAMEERTRRENARAAVEVLVAKIDPCRSSEEIGEMLKQFQNREDELVKGLEGIIEMLCGEGDEIDDGRPRSGAGGAGHPVGNFEDKETDSRTSSSDADSFRSELELPATTLKSTSPRAERSMPNLFADDLGSTANFEAGQPVCIPTSYTKCSCHSTQESSRTCTTIECSEEQSLAGTGFGEMSEFFGFSCGFESFDECKEQESILEEVERLVQDIDPRFANEVYDIKKQFQGREMALLSSLRRIRCAEIARRQHVRMQVETLVFAIDPRRSSADVDIILQQFEHRETELIHGLREILRTLGTKEVGNGGDSVSSFSSELMSAERLSTCVMDLDSFSFHGAEPEERNTGFEDWPSDEDVSDDDSLATEFTIQQEERWIFTFE